VTVARHGDGRRTAGASWAAASTQQHSCDTQGRGSTANGCYGAKRQRGWACCAQQLGHGAQGLGSPARGRCCYVDVAARRSRARARGVCTPGHRLAACCDSRRQGIQSRAKEPGCWDGLVPVHDRACIQRAWRWQILGCGKGSRGGVEDSTLAKGAGARQARQQRWLRPRAGNRVLDA
jgi:hypothetical protein